MKKILMGFLLLVGVLNAACGFACGFASNGAQVARREFYPDALLRKYEWFKDASASLDKKVADIGVYQFQMDSLKMEYEGVPRSKWPRDDRETYSVLSSQLAGIKASYNSLSAEYNSQMSKGNWAFTNVGDLPPGATNPLPREYKPYLEK